MSWLERFSNLWRRRHLDHELDEELQFHLDARARDNRAAGMSDQAARLDARRRFGSPLLTQERTHEADVFAGLETFWRDLRVSARSLCKSPAFAAVCILTLALGIGANTAVFTIVNGVLLRPLPFPEPDRLFLISYFQPTPGIPAPGLNETHYLEFERRNRSFERVATFAMRLSTLTGTGEAIQVRPVEVTPSFFSALRVNPALGRPFLDAEKRSHVVILSDALWRSRFSADPAILGKTLSLDAVPYTVVGVMPPGFAFPDRAQLWLPLVVEFDGHNSFTRTVIARLLPGVSPGQAHAEWQALAENLPIGTRLRRTDLVAEMLPLKSLLTAGIRTSLLIFMGAVAFVLLIACANVANLLLMRSSSRRREIAVRSALGAGRARLVRQMLTESTLLSLCGAAAGLLIATAGVPALLRLAPTGFIPRSGPIHVDLSVLAFALAVGVLTGIGFGLLPALRSTSTTWHDFAATARREHLRGVLVAGEIALTLVLLAGAGLMLKSFIRMRSVNPGFQAEKVLTMTVDLPASIYKDLPEMRAFHRRVLERLAGLPGMVSAGAVNWMPLQRFLVGGTFHLPDGRRTRSVNKPAVSEDYFRAMGIRLLYGRGFTGQDNETSTPVAIVSQSVARAYWPEGQALGQRLTLEDNAKPEDWLTIVGVVDDIRQRRLTDPPRDTIYQPYTQVTHRDFLRHMTFALHTVTDPRAIAPTLRAVLQEIDRDQPVESLATMSDLIAENTAEPEFQARLITTFSILALLISAIGIYGVLAYAVAERTREIGIRMALGAERRDITGMILRRSLTLAAIGIVIGLAGALAVTRVLAKLLYQVTPTDPLTFAGAAALLLLVAIVAGLPSARSATKVDPLVALRWD